MDHHPYNRVLRHPTREHILFLLEHIHMLPVSVNHLLPYNINAILQNLLAIANLGEHGKSSLVLTSPICALQYPRVLSTATKE